LFFVCEAQFSECLDLDSRLRGNDEKKCGNDEKKCGNDEKRCGNDEKENSGMMRKMRE
jgi:hypothetical protein